MNRHLSDVFRDPEILIFVGKAFQRERRPRGRKEFGTFEEQQDRSVRLEQRE